MPRAGSTVPDGPLPDHEDYERAPQREAGRWQPGAPNQRVPASCAGRSSIASVSVHATVPPRPRACGSCRLSALPSSERDAVPIPRAGPAGHLPAPRLRGQCPPGSNPLLGSLGIGSGRRYGVGQFWARLAPVPLRLRQRCASPARSEHKNRAARDRGRRARSRERLQPRLPQYQERD